VHPVGANAAPGNLAAQGQEEAQVSPLSPPVVTHACLQTFRCLALLLLFARYLPTPRFQTGLPMLYRWRVKSSMLMTSEMMRMLNKIRYRPPSGLPATRISRRCISVRGGQ
jgi:hypothetical protein